MIRNRASGGYPLLLEYWCHSHFAASQVAPWLVGRLGVSHYDRILDRQQLAIVYQGSSTDLPTSSDSFFYIMS